MCLCKWVGSGGINMTRDGVGTVVAMEHGFVDDNFNDLKRNIVITGPNASGKTTYLKTTAINIILSQQISCGFYQKCILNPFTCFLSSYS